MAFPSLDVPRFVQEHITNTLRIQDPSLAFFTLFSNYDIRYVHGNDLGFQKSYVDDRRNFVFSVLNVRHDIQCIGCDIDGVFMPTETLDPALQFYINQIKPPLPQVFYQVPDILNCQAS
jgi:hypothetical protein